MADWNQQVIDEFRANGGRVGGRFQGRTLLLLHHRGAKTGIERINPVAYQRLSEDSVAVFASKGGASTNPDWYHNIAPMSRSNSARRLFRHGRASQRVRSATRSGNGRSATGRVLPNTRRRQRGSERSPSSCSTRLGLADVISRRERQARSVRRQPGRGPRRAVFSRKR